MICQRCLLRLGSWRAPLPRFVSTSRSLNAERIQAARGPPSGSHEGPPAATSTSKAQPFSASMTPAEPPQQPTTLTPARVVSSVKAGTVFKGLGFYKNKDPPVAMEDHEYPDWLWTLLDKGEKSISGTAGSENDLYGMNVSLAFPVTKRITEYSQISTHATACTKSGAKGYTSCRAGPFCTRGTSAYRAPNDRPARRRWKSGRVDRSCSRARRAQPSHEKSPEKIDKGGQLLEGHALSIIRSHIRVGNRSCFKCTCLTPNGFLDTLFQIYRSNTVHA